MITSVKHVRKAAVTRDNINTEECAGPSRPSAQSSRQSRSAVAAGAAQHSKDLRRSLAHRACCAHPGSAAGTTRHNNAVQLERPRDHQCTTVNLLSDRGQTTVEKIYTHTHRRAQPPLACQKRSRRQEVLRDPAQRSTAQHGAMC
jgi:hypothetical protein